MRRIKLGFVLLFGALSVLLLLAATQTSATQKKGKSAVPSTFRENNCVI